MNVSDMQALEMIVMMNNSIANTTKAEPQDHEKAILNDDPVSTANSNIVNHLGHQQKFDTAFR